jgi:hypothetical protein
MDNKPSTGRAARHDVAGFATVRQALGPTISAGSGVICSLGSPRTNIERNRVPRWAREAARKSFASRAEDGPDVRENARVVARRWPTLRRIDCVAVLRPRPGSLARASHRPTALTAAEEAIARARRARACGRSSPSPSAAPARSPRSSGQPRAR